PGQEGNAEEGRGRSQGCTDEEGFGRQAGGEEGGRQEVTTRAAPLRERPRPCRTGLWSLRRPAAQVRNRQGDATVSLVRGPGAKNGRVLPFPGNYREPYRQAFDCAHRHRQVRIAGDCRETPEIGRAHV